MRQNTVLSSGGASADWLERVKLQHEQFAYLCRFRFVPLSASERVS
jgi:hypothetical protein